MTDLAAFARANREGSGQAIVSVCSAHPDVLEASLLLAAARRTPIVIEATSNQCNQFGGYTDMTPADFIALVGGRMARHGIDPGLVLFGGDHMVPQVWRSEPAQSAMAKAHEMIQGYVSAGFTKIHLDCSEGCAGEPAHLADAIVAARGADLAATCEAAAGDRPKPVYVIGTEVPPPGGARVGEDDAIEATPPDRAARTLAIHREAILAQGLSEAWARVVGLVVQPGLEFAPTEVFAIDTARPDLLSPAPADHSGLCFEAHSTDYQADAVFPDLARRHLAFLKVGPALTFAYRQAIYALDHLRHWLNPDDGREPLPALMERLMRAQPQYCKRCVAPTFLMAV